MKVFLSSTLHLAEGKITFVKIHQACTSFDYFHPLGIVKKAGCSKKVYRTLKCLERLKTILQKMKIHQPENVYFYPFGPINETDYFSEKRVPRKMKMQNWYGK